MLGLDPSITGLDVRALERGEQLPDISGPRVGLQQAHGEWGAARVRSTLNASVEGFRDERNVLPSSSEGRQLNLHNVQPIVQVVAELARQSLDAAPNPAHHALVRIEQRVEHFVLLTQNVDGLHRLAGSRNLIEIHGDVFATRCTSCGRTGRLDGPTLVGLVSAPRCSHCNGLLRPDAVLFGEMIPQERYGRLVAEFHTRSPDLLIVAGTSAPFPYIAEPVRVARQRGRLTLEINTEKTVLSRTVDYALRGPAGEVLPLIDAAI